MQIGLAKQQGSLVGKVIRAFPDLVIIEETETGVKVVEFQDYGQDIEHTLSDENEVTFMDDSTSLHDTTRWFVLEDRYPALKGSMTAKAVLTLTRIPREFGAPLWDADLQFTAAPQGAVIVVRLDERELRPQQGNLKSGLVASYRFTVADSSHVEIEVLSSHRRRSFGLSSGALHVGTRTIYAHVELNLLILTVTIDGTEQPT